MEILCARSPSTSLASLSTRIHRYIRFPRAGKLMPYRHSPLNLLTEESLTVLHGLGLQTSTVSSVYLRTPNTRFIPTTSIQDVFIHEAFKGFEVRFYLAVVVKGEEDVVVVFPRLLPCREVLEEVWRGARACLYEGTGQKRESVEKAS